MIVRKVLRSCRRHRKAQEREHYGYELAGVVDGGLLLNLLDEGNFWIGRGAQGGSYGVHSRNARRCRFKRMNVV